ncbi:BLUF domain-containing protein [Azospirillum sp. SYSU D00513]|uniref:BLUF domain-containing protein n=1 Tax=Azospirillum sp. SYSU D00513 TaxID=2812561 RepID=UPI001A9778E7|nr:BLUF domain-containing protein [Azospirillum sp. SYSU D00513]
MYARLAYYSEITSEFSAEMMHDIVRKSQMNNACHGVTGCLVQHGKYFIQLLEGPRSVLTRLFCAIAKDSRHTNVVLVELRDISAARFPGWNMLNISNQFMPAIQGVLFDPDAFTGSALGHTMEKAARYLEELRSADPKAAAVDAGLAPSVHA